MNQRDAVVQALTEASLTMDQLVSRVSELTGHTPMIGSISVVISRLRIDEGRTILMGGRPNEPARYTLK